MSCCAERYHELYGYFKYLYLKKHWFDSFHHRRDDEFICDLFHDVLFLRMSGDPSEETTFDQIMKDFRRDDEKCQNESAWKAYLAMVFQNRITDILRKRQKDPVQFAQEDDDQKVVDHHAHERTAGLAVAADLQRISEDIKKTHLTGEMSRLLALYYRREMTYADVAKATGRSTSGIGHLMKRMFDLLKKVIVEKTPIPPWLEKDREILIGLLLDYAEQDLLACAKAG